MLFYGLKDRTEDLDIKIKPEYFEELKTKISFKKSPKFDYLYEMADDVEVAVLDFSENDIDIVDGYPVEKLEIELKWKLEHKRGKDIEAIKIITDFLNRKG